MGATLTTAIRKVDRRHLITVGLVDWSLDRPGGLYSGFDPAKIAADLDFLSVHLYPKKGKIDKALKTLAGFDVGKPVLIEETFPTEMLHRGIGEVLRWFEEDGRRMDGFFLGSVAGGTAALEDTGRRLDAAMAGVLSETQAVDRTSPKR